MKKKQWLGFIAAALVFVLVGVVSAVTNSYIDDALGGLGVLDGEFVTPSTPYIGVVSIEGTIGDYANYATGELYTDSPIYYIQTYRDDPLNEGLMLYIDSPGGSVYETDEIYLAIMDYKQTTGRPVYAWGGSYVASGAYYIASAADELTVNRNCWTGSIGVYIQVQNVAGLMEKFGIENEYIKTGDNKAMGSMYEALTDEQRAIYQGLVDDAYETFLSVVIEGRGYTREELLPIADGRVYTASQALENGLIDGVNDYAAALSDLMDECGVDEYCLPPAPSGLTGILDYFISARTKSDTQAALDYIDGLGTVELMYYAG